MHIEHKHSILVTYAMRLIARLIDDTVASWLSNKTQFIMSHNYNGTSYYKYNNTFQITAPLQAIFRFNHYGTVEEVMVYQYGRSDFLDIYII